MTHARRFHAYILAACVMCGCASAAELGLRSNDRVVFLGNTFAERLRHTGYFETGLLLRYPDLGLTFRNLGWSADEVALRPRPLNFGDIHTHLTAQEADVIFVCYGFNESFAGKEGLSSFRKAYQELIDDLAGHQYNGESAPRLVIVSPIPQEPIPGMPDATERNRDLAAYTDVLREIAAENGLPFINLFSRLQQLRSMDRGLEFTFNGIHLNDYGAWVAANLMLSELGMDTDPATVRIDIAKNEARFDAGSIEIVGGEPTRLRVRLTAKRAAYVPPPVHAGRMGDSWLFAPQLRIVGLAPGRYALRSGGQALAEADHSQWAQGVPVPRGFYAGYVEAVREKVIHKNQLFFDRWRAVNGYYIYGGRKKPFGVVNFPPEMRRFDELIREEETAILREVRQPPPQSITVELVD